MDLLTDQLLTGFVVAVVIAVAARHLRALSPSGAVATILLGTIVFGLGGVAWAIPLLVFFMLSSVLSQVSKQLSRSDFAKIFEKGGERDVGQVLANGGVAGGAVLLNFFFPHPIWYPAFVGSLAAAAADTWATEIGVLSRGSVRSVLTFRVVPPGTSGGVSLVGSLGCCAGAGSVAFSGAMFAVDPFGLLIGATVAGIIGAFADSLLGATVQAGYRCPRCLTFTERREHCRVETELIRGSAWINNDVVNIGCCMVGGAVSAFICGWR